MSEEDIKKRWQEFVTLLRQTKRENIESVIEWLDKSDFKEAPASTKYHLNCKGGLLEHSLNVYHVLKEDLIAYTELLQIPEDTIIITALLHDICKADLYISDVRNVKKDGVWVQEPFYKTDDLYPYGHGEKSVDIITNECGVKLSKLERMMIRWHMGFADRMPYDVQISDAFTKCPPCLLLHTADVFSTYFIECNSEGFEKYEHAGYKDRFEGRSATDSLNLLNKQVVAKVEVTEEKRYATIDGVQYEVAPDDAVVDGETVIYVNCNGRQVKVYAPYGDGLPF